MAERSRRPEPRPRGWTLVSRPGDVVGPFLQHVGPQSPARSCETPLADGGRCKARGADCCFPCKARVLLFVQSGSARSAKVKPLARSASLGHQVALCAERPPKSPC